MLRLAVLLIPLLLIVPVTSVAGDGSPPPPEHVAALLLGREVLVAWSDEVQADEYRVYGVTSTSRTLIGATTDFALAVPAGFSTYAVAAVVDGVEGDATTANGGVCVHFTPSPPDVAVHEDCNSSGVGLGAMATLP